MANPYPANVIADDGQVRIQGEIDFTDPDNRPGGGVNFDGWTDDGGDPANVASNGGGLNLGGGLLFAGSAAIATELDVGFMLLTGLAGSVAGGRLVGFTAAAAPTTGAHLVGDVAVSLTGHVFVCTAAGTPGTWVDAAVSFLSSAGTITAGALPNTGAWVSGTAKQNPVARQVSIALEIVTDGSANAATCAVAISPDDTTFTTIATPGASVAVNTVGAVTLLSTVTLPAGWWIKLTLAHCAVAASVYY